MSGRIRIYSQEPVTSGLSRQALAAQECAQCAVLQQHLQELTQRLQDHQRYLQELEEQLRHERSARLTAERGGAGQGSMSAVPLRLLDGPSIAQIPVGEPLLAVELPDAADDPQW
jgi:hypothetical protein